MNAKQIKVIYEVARILEQPKKEYLNRVIEFNTGEEELGIYQPVALVDIEATFVHSLIHLKNAEVLFNIDKFKDTSLCGAIIWTHGNVAYNGSTVFTLGGWIMIGILMTGKGISRDSEVYYSGIYLKDEDRTFGFFKLNEFLKK